MSDDLEPTLFIVGMAEIVFLDPVGLQHHSITGTNEVIRQLQRGDCRIHQLTNGRGVRIVLCPLENGDRGGAKRIWRRSIHEGLRTKDILYHPRILANIKGATMVASDSMIYFGVSIPSFPQVIFSFGTAPEYDP